MSRFDKNYENGGYLMNYETPKLNTAEKRRVLQFMIILQDIEPVIWRRIQVPSDYNFWDLHVAIQDAMGWQDSHLHRFEIKGRRKRKEVHIGIPDFDRFEGVQEIFPGWEIPVGEHFNDLGVTAKYIYDYGDDWHHTVVLEGYILNDTQVEYPICLNGERACPPEDCGGAGGYGDLIKTLSDPKDEEYEALKEWAGVNWSPEKFDPKQVSFDNPYIRWFKAFLRR